MKSFFRAKLIHRFPALRERDKKQETPRVITLLFRRRLLSCKTWSLADFLKIKKKHLNFERLLKGVLTSVLFVVEIGMGSTSYITKPKAAGYRVKSGSSVGSDKEMNGKLKRTKIRRVQIMKII